MDMDMDMAAGLHVDCFVLVFVAAAETPGRGMVREQLRTRVLAVVLVVLVCAELCCPHCHSRAVPGSRGPAAVDRQLGLSQSHVVASSMSGVD